MRDPGIAVLAFVSVLSACAGTGGGPPVSRAPAGQETTYLSPDGLYAYCDARHVTIELGISRPAWMPIESTGPVTFRYSGSIGTQLAYHWEYEGTFDPVPGKRHSVSFDIGADGKPRPSVALAHLGGPLGYTYIVDGHIPVRAADWSKCERK